MSENNSYTIKLESQKLNGENRYSSCDMVEELGLFEAMKVRDFVKDLIKKRCPPRVKMFFKLESGNVVNLDNVAYYGACWIFFAAVEENGESMGISITQGDRKRLNELLFGNKDEEA